VTAAASRAGAAILGDAGHSAGSLLLHAAPMSRVSALTLCVVAVSCWGWKVRWGNSCGEHIMAVTWILFLFLLGTFALCLSTIYNC
jgi:hypothetical protein